MKFLQGYPQDTLTQVQQMLAEGRVGLCLLQKYPGTHGVRTDRALYNFVQSLKAEYLRMIVVHELAHLRERSHDKPFYQLCTYMEPSYHQLEFETRMYLTHLDAGGARLWEAPASTDAAS